MQHQQTAAEKAHDTISRFFDQRGGPNIDYTSPKKFQKCHSDWTNQAYYVGAPEQPRPGKTHYFKRDGWWYVRFEHVVAEVGSTQLKGIFW